MSHKRMHYKIIEITKEEVEALNIMSVTKVHALATNQITDIEENIVITFLQLVDYYSMQKTGEITGTKTGGGSKVIIEVVDNKG